MEYNVILLDRDGFEIAANNCFSIPEAKAAASLMLSRAYADYNGTTHTALGTHKVEIRNLKGECVFDAFLKR